MPIVDVKDCSLTSCKLHFTLFANPSISKNFKNLIGASMYYTY